MLEISRTDMSLPQRTSAPPSVCCLAQQQASSLSSGRREPSGHVLRASAPPYTGGIAGLPPARHYEPVGDATPASSSLEADVAGRSTAQPLRRPPRGVRAIGAGVDASSEDGTSTAHRREQEEDPLVEEKLGKTPSDRRATPPMANGDDSRTTSYAATRTSLQPRISAWDRCKTARAIAAQWMTTLMDQPPVAERIQEYLQQQQQQQDGRSPVTANAPCPDSGDATSTTSAVERPTHPSSFVEAVRSGNSKSKTSCSMVHARPTSASTTGPSTPSLRPSAAVDEAKPRGGLSTTAAVLDTNPRSSTPVPGDVGYQNVVLLPEDTSTIPTLLHELREIATSCSSVDHSEKPIACSSGGQRRGNGRNRLRPTAAAPPAHDADDMEQQWNTVRSHLDAVRGLIINSHEFSQALDEALGMDWRHDAPSTVDEELPSGSLQQASPSSLEKAADAEEVGELKDSAKDRKADGNHSVGSSSSLNLNAAPFYISNSTYDAADAAYYNPSPNLISLLDRGSSSNNAAFPSAPPNPVGISPTESYGSLNPYSPSQPVVPESTLGNNNASVTPPGALGSTTSGGPKSPILPYNLESRESMLRRRSAAPNAFYASASQGGGVHFLSGSPHQSYNSGSSYMSPVMAHPHSGHHLPISPLLTYASPVQLPRCMYDFLLVLDFEATCDEQVPTDYLYEIIEFPVVLVDVRLQRVVSEFHSYVRPRHKTQLSEFCHALTGIEQSDVDEALPLEEVLKQFERWYNNTVPPNSRVVFATDGPTDLRKFMYVHSVVRQGIKFPALFYQFIDVKQVFASFFDCPSGKIQAMLEVLHSPFTGRLHSGIDDARNIATIVIRLLQYGCTMQEVPLCVVHPSTPPTSVQGKPPRSGGAYTGSNGSLTPLTGLSQLPPSTTSLLGNPNHSHDGAVGEASMSTTCLPPSVTSLGNN